MNKELNELREYAVTSLKDNDQSLAKFKDFCMTAFTGLSLKELIELAACCENIERAMVKKVGEFVDEIDTRTLQTLKDMDNTFTMCTLMGAQQLFATAIESVLDQCGRLESSAAKASDECDNQSPQDSDND